MSLAADLPAHLALSVEVKEDASAAAKIARGLKERILEDEEDLNTADSGMSLLELKNLLMTDYLSNLSYVMLKKASGKRLEGDAAVERLVTIRTVLEKLRPMEQKLRYQIGKALKVADSGVVNEDDPLFFKANPKALVSKLAGAEDDDEDGDGDDVTDRSKKQGKYVVPKHVPVFYDDGSGHVEEEAAIKSKKHQLSKGLIEELKRQHLETPEEIFEQEDVLKKRQVQAIKDRIRYEEDNFIRLPLSKKVKHGRRQMSTAATIGDEVTSFGLNYFSAGGGVGVGDKKRKKKSGKGFKKGGAKKKFRK